MKAWLRRHVSASLWPFFPGHLSCPRVMVTLSPQTLVMSASAYKGGFGLHPWCSNELTAPVRHKRAWLAAPVDVGRLQQLPSRRSRRKVKEGFRSLWLLAESGCADGSVGCAPSLIELSGDAHDVLQVLRAARRCGLPGGCRTPCGPP